MYGAPSGLPAEPVLHCSNDCGDPPMTDADAHRAALVEEARAIVAGAALRPTREHLWALLAWLDGTSRPLADTATEH
jgi:hypothetical protein